eukprot:513599_1
MICIECGAPVNNIYRDYGKGSIRLSHCPKCGKVADKYIEYQLVLILLDLILHRHQVYRHLLFNRIDYHESGVHIILLKMIPALICFDAYLKWFRLAKYYESVDSVIVSLMSPKPFDCHFIILGAAALEFVLFISGVLLCAKLLHFRVDTHFVKYNYLVMAILISSFGRLLILLMMIWDYDVKFGSAVNVFVLTSNFTATKVFLDGTDLQAGFCVLGGYAMRMMVPVFTFMLNSAFIIFPV